MSLDATRWAWKQRCKKSIDKLVLLSMADRADETHCCYPSIKRLEIDTEANRKTIIAAIDRLEKLSLLVDTGERKGITKSVKVYRLIGVTNRSQNEVVPKAELLPFSASGEGAALGVAEDQKTSNTKNGTTCGKPISDTENGTAKADPKTGHLSGEAIPKTGQLEGEAVPFLRGSSTENGTKNLSRNQQIDRYTEIFEIHKKLVSVGMNEIWLTRMEDRKVMKSWIELNLSEEILDAAITKANYAQQGKRYGVKYLDPIIKQLIFTRDHPGDIHGTDKPIRKSIQQLDEEGAEAFLNPKAETEGNVFDVSGGHG